MGTSIKNPAQCQQLGVAQITVDIRAKNSAGAMRQLQTIAIGPNQDYGKADLSLLTGMRPDERAYYHLTATNGQGGTVADFEGLPVGGVHPWDPLCSRTCEAPTYAWSLNAYQSSSLGSVTIELDNAGDGLGPYYFYVPDEGPNGWVWWITHMYPSDFGLAHEWSWYDGSGSNQTDVVHLNSDIGGAPAGATDWQGYPIAPHTPVHAIRKDRGTWRTLYAATNNMIAAGFNCDNLLAYFNADANVQFQMAQNSLPPLGCTRYLTTEGIGGETPDNTDVFGPCRGITLGNNGNIMQWAMDYIDCMLNIMDGLNASSGIQVNRWANGATTTMLSVAMPDSKDPKLARVPKTELLPGLYEFLIVLDNGRILRHFEEFTQPRVITADFADFADINIYPVPVADKTFAVDFNLVAPMAITMSVVDNTGHPWYNKQLNFDMAGRNKHVVEMQPAQWPAGIYHAIFQFQDGSSRSLNFNVVQP